MNREKLEKLRDFLNKLPPERFDYSHWAGSDWQGHQDLSCGTTACALGWAVTLFPDELEFRSYTPKTLTLDRLIVDVHAKNTIYPCTNLYAGMEVFDLVKEDAEFLFLPKSYVEEKKPPTYVAKKIQWLLDGRDIYDWSVEDGD